LTDAISLPVPAERTKSYKPYVDKELELGLRPEHITEARSQDGGRDLVTFETRIDVVEPMGNDTMVYFMIEGRDVCARVRPRAACDPGESMTLMADMSHMHLIDPATKLVIQV
jgi:multiple sugar transport system ATP-binding protein